MEGPPPVPGENLVEDGGDSSITFSQAEEVSYNYSTSKEAGWNVGVESEFNAGAKVDLLIAPFGFGTEFSGGTVGSSYCIIER